MDNKKSNISRFYVFKLIDNKMRIDVEDGYKRQSLEKIILKSR